MNDSTEILRQGHRLLQVGITLFLIALVVGLFVPKFTVPRIGLSVHLLGITQGIFLMLLGSLWPRLRLSRLVLKIAFWLAVYGCLSAWTTTLFAGIWGAGNRMLPLAAGAAHGTRLQETLIALGLRSAALALIVAAVLILWGLRSFAPERKDI